MNWNKVARRSPWLLALLACWVVAACDRSTGSKDENSYGGGGSGGSGGSGGDGGSQQCAYKAPGTQMAPCDTDSDCYSGFCDQTGNPGPYCFVPTQAARDSGHGYPCSTNADCDDVLDSDAIASGIFGECRNDDIYAGCLFGCSTGTSTSTSTGTSSSSTTSTGAGTP